MKPKWQVELEEGQIWRAKEILRTYIGIRYNKDEYVAYGKILYELEDLFDAGKYLFLAGEPIAGRYKDAIEIYLNRFKHSDKLQMSSTFPRSFKQLTYDETPLSVKEYLDNKGYEKKEYIRNQYYQEPITSKGKLLGILFSSFIGLVFIVGFYTVSKTAILWLNEIGNYYYVDKCLDAGGKWDEKKNECNQPIP